MLYRTDLKRVKISMTQISNQNIVDSLLSFGKSIDSRQLFPVLVPDASNLVLSNPYAFVLATCLDRGTKSEIIWTIPYYIKNDLGHIDPYKINLMNQEDLNMLFSRLPYKPRYINAAPQTVKDITSIVVKEFKGKANLIWEGKKATEARYTFQRVFGVGEGIANMAVLLIEKAFNVHTVRVLHRLGVSKEKTTSSAIDAARRLNPKYPGEIDAPLWIIGRTWCNEMAPICNKCPLEKYCLKAGIRSIV
jgi:endonuclease III